MLQIRKFRSIFWKHPDEFHNRFLNLQSHFESPVDIPSGLRGVTTPVPKSPIEVPQEPAGDVASPTPLSGQAAAEPPQTETTGGRVLTRDGQPYAVYEEDRSVTTGVHTQQPSGETEADDDVSEGPQVELFGGGDSDVEEEEEFDQQR